MFTYIYIYISCICIYFHLFAYIYTYLPIFTYIDNIFRYLFTYYIYLHITYIYIHSHLFTLDLPCQHSMRMAPLAVSQTVLDMQATSHLKKELGIESDPMVVPQPGQIWGVLKIGDPQVTMGINLQNHLIQDDSRIWSNSGLFEDTSI